MPVKKIITDSDLGTAIQDAIASGSSELIEGLIEQYFAEVSAADISVGLPVDNYTPLVDNIKAYLKAIDDQIGQIDNNDSDNEASVPSGGTTGQVLAKSSAADFDIGWVNPSEGGGSNIAVVPPNSSATTGQAADAAATYQAFLNIQTPDNVVIDPDYVHTDNNFTDDDKEAIENLPADFNFVKLSNATQQTINSDIGLAEGKRLFAIDKDNINHEVLGINKYNVNGTDYNQTEINSELKLPLCLNFGVVPGWNDDEHILINYKDANGNNKADKVAMLSDIEDQATETWVKSYVGGAISGLIGVSLDVVSELPETGNANTIYLLGTASPYEEWIYVNDEWDKIGDTSVNLDNYYTAEETNEAISAVTSSIPTDNNQLVNGAGYQTAEQVNAAIQAALANYISGDGTITQVVKVASLPATPVSTTLYAIPE
ncbi:hypothetical protein FACS189443_1800 [Planctomycetales bacterium]|nr:hypothetical protein FACS189443_1800 [Planctomycetales bacterium]